ncbi:MAG: histidine kinase [Lachnospiraceae bacterium]|nr:histidine kinase [Lachnospiraceae bacterium]
MMKNKRSRFQTQIIYIFLVTIFSLFAVNIYVFQNVRFIIESVDGAYAGNRALTEMRDWLDTIHTEALSYLNTRDESVLNQFYTNEAKYKEFLTQLEHEGAMTEIELREMALWTLSSNYIQAANKAVLSKMNGNVEDYVNYENQMKIKYEYLTTAMTNLNQQMFVKNSTTYGVLYDATRVTQMLYMILFILTGGADILILVLLIRRLTRPLEELVDLSEKVGEGNLDVQLSSVEEQEEYNEIGILRVAFNRMVIRLKDYMEQVRVSVEAESAMREKAIRMEASVKDAKLKYLQAQINPHFLFNTLNAGAQLAMMEDAEKTYRYIHKVADFFRYKIQNDDGIATLQEELRTVDDYVYILNVRYGNDLHYECHVEEGYENLTMPSMILQPIVENAMKHGLSEVDWEKKIEIEVTEDENDVVISIRDNGVGMDFNQLEEALSNKHRHEGIGLENVLTRLRTFYGRENVMEITSVGKNMGTEIALILPKETGIKEYV